MDYFMMDGWMSFFGLQNGTIHSHYKAGKSQDIFFYVTPIVFGCKKKVIYTTMA